MVIRLRVQKIIDEIEKRQESRRSTKEECECEECLKLRKTGD